MTLYRSRARRRTRRLIVLGGLCTGLALVGVAVQPAAAMLADARSAVGGTVARPEQAPAPAGVFVDTGRGATAAPPSATPPAAPSSTPSAPPVAPPSAPPAGSVPASRPISSVPAGSVALTVDDGPDPRWTPQVLDLLAARHVHATFCLIGTEVRAHPELVRRIVAGGHTLCDHTETHDEQLPQRSRATVDREVRTAYDDIVAASGVRPRLFRAPGGNWSPAIITAAADLGMRPLGWDVDTRDWTRPGTAAIAAAVSGAPSGSVILVHDGGGDRSQTVAALKTAIPALQARGLTFTTP